MKSLAFALLTLIYPQPKRKKPPLRGGRYHPESRGFVEQKYYHKKGHSPLFVVLMLIMVPMLIVMLQMIFNVVPEPPLRPIDLQYKVDVLEKWAFMNRFSDRQYRMMGDLFDWEIPDYIETKP